MRTAITISLEEEKHLQYNLAPVVIHTHLKNNSLRNVFMYKFPPKDHTDLVINVLIYSHETHKRNSFSSCKTLVSV